MSFGVVQSMIASLKSNRDLLDKRSKLKGTLSGKESKKLEFKSLKATSEQLKEIKEKLQQENKIARTKQAIMFTIIIVIITSIVMYLILIKRFIKIL
ncbi:hypothetical protein ACFQ1R_15525 [Mariniflexile jejuense]|uniref:Uncharacterized protein n=1 Tax=Mariniflexile jejuense TaxID=1173582 RepID=A0ABW3JM60_9FLAO